MENEKTEIISAKYITEQTNHMEYQPGMDNIGSEVQDEVISRMNAYDADAYTAADVLRALRKDVLSPEDFGALLSPAALPFLEQMAQRAQAETAGAYHLGLPVHALGGQLFFKFRNDLGALGGGAAGAGAHQDVGTDQTHMTAPPIPPRRWCSPSPRGR